MLLGAHMSIAGGVEKSITRGREIGCLAIQIFTKNNNQWKAKPLGTEEIRQFKELREVSRMFVMGHTSYLINLASPDDNLWKKSVESFFTEMERCELLGIPCLVLHPGAHMGEGEEPGLARVTRALDEICERTKGSPVTVLLEVTAGQGSALGCRFEHLARLLEDSSFPGRLGICFDTCHAFAAGYDLRTPEAYGETFARLESLTGPGKLKAFHLNDSRGGLGSRLDRHEHIGKGQLGLEAFRLLLNDPRFRDLPMLLETPKGKDLKEDVENLATLRGLIL
ncbi:MAG: deoxyribonuclease IV [Eubacteriales bacterium]